MSSGSERETNVASWGDELNKIILTGSKSGQTSSDFRSTNIMDTNPGRILPNAKNPIQSSGNAGTQGQTGTSTNKTTQGQVSEGLVDHYKK